MVRASLCLLAGMLVPQLSSFPRYSDFFGGSILSAPGVLALVTASGFLLVRVLPVASRRAASWCLAGTVLFCLHAGFASEARLPEAWAGDSLLVQVRILDFPRESAFGTSFTSAPVDDSRVPPRLRLTWFDAPVRVRMGDVWHFELRLKPPHGSQNPGTPDVEKWLFRERIGATGYVVESRRNRLLDSGTHGVIARVREHFSARLEAVVPDRDSAAVLAALVVGTRHLLDDEQWERYAATGTSHLMAISGLHVGLAAGGAYLLFAGILGLPGSPRNHHVLALGAALGVACAYAVLSGFAVPARRASLMLGLFVLALLSRRESCGAKILAAAALVVLLADPLSVLAPGFLLSYAAVALLLWIGRRQADAGRGFLQRAGKAVLLISAMQFALLLGLAPLTAVLFDRVSLAAPAVNLVAVPLFSFCTVPLALLGFVLDGPLVVAGNGLLRASAASIAVLEQLLAAVARQESAARTIAAREGLAWLCLALPVLWVVLPRRWPGRGLAWLGFAGLLALRPAPPAPGCVELTMLDVGQGLALAGRTAKHVLLYDTGPLYRSGGTAAERYILPFLANRGIERIDRLVVSHSDLDHAGGAAAIVRALGVRYVQSGDTLALPNRAVGRCHAGDSWQWDGVRFTFLHPPLNSRQERNDASCVLLVEAGKWRALLAGDIEAPVEARLVQARVLPTVEMTTVPHHGSRSSSTVPYLRSLSARYALVSAARHNQWAMPQEDVVERWRNVGATVLTTGDGGAIRVELCAAAATSVVRAYRIDERRLWHAAGQTHGVIDDGF